MLKDLHYNHVQVSRQSVLNVSFVGTGTYGLCLRTSPYISVEVRQAIERAWAPQSSRTAFVGSNRYERRSQCCRAVDAVDGWPMASVLAQAGKLSSVTVNNRRSDGR